MAQPTATGTQLSTNIGSGDQLGRTSHGGFVYPWGLTAYWNESDSSPDVATLTAGLPVQPGTSTTWAITLPAANIGMQAMAASLSVVPASDITDATYIGDIKFGESLPTGSATIGAVNIAAAQTLANVTTVATVTNLAQLAGAAVPIGAGLEATAVRVTLPTDGTGVVNLGTIGSAATAAQQSTGNATISTMNDKFVNVALGADNLAPGDIGIVCASLGWVYDGSAWDRVRGDSTNGVLVNLGANNDMTLATLPDTAADDLANITAIAAQLSEGSVAVTGTFWQATQPVSLASVPSHAVTGPLTDTQLRATAVPISVATIPSHAVTNAGTFIVQVDGTALTALQLLDDTVYVDESAFTTTSSKVLAIGALATPTDTAVPANQVGAVGMSADRRMWVDAHIVGQDTNIPVAYGSGTFQIAGTVDLGATDNAVLDSINGSTATTAAVTTTSLVSLQSIDGKITACNTGAVVVSSGTITANLGATDNAVLDAIAASVAGTLTVGSHAVTNAGTFATQATLQTGSATIGKLAANSGVDIGDVDVLSVIPGTAATNLGKARGSALGATDTGVASLAVRNDDLADLAGADADYAPMQVDENGALYVSGTRSAVANASGVAASGTTAMVAAVASRKIQIHALFLKATSATVTNVYLATTTDTDVLGNVGNPIPLAIDADGDNDSGFVLPFNPGGWTTTSTNNEALNLILSAAQDVIWAITYSYVL